MSGASLQGVTGLGSTANSLGWFSELMLFKHITEDFMKKLLLAAAALVPATAAFASPAASAKIVASCCSLAAACCEMVMACCG